MDRFQKVILAGADINQRDDQNQTPLHYAAIHGREPILMVLVKQTAFLDAKDINGMTPLHHVASKKLEQSA
jgi:ankyrin repeat protein